MKIITTEKIGAILKAIGMGKLLLDKLKRSSDNKATTVVPDFSFQLDINGNPILDGQGHPVYDTLGPLYYVEAKKDDSILIKNLNSFDLKSIVNTLGSNGTGYSTIDTNNRVIIKESKINWGGGKPPFYLFLVYYNETTKTYTPLQTSEVLNVKDSATLLGSIGLPITYIREYNLILNNYSDFALCSDYSIDPSDPAVQHNLGILIVDSTGITSADHNKLFLPFIPKIGDKLLNIYSQYGFESITAPFIKQNTSISTTYGIPITLATFAASGLVPGTRGTSNTALAGIINHYYYNPDVNNLTNIVGTTLNGYTGSTPTYNVVQTRTIFSPTDTTHYKEATLDANIIINQAQIRAVPTSNPAVSDVYGFVTWGSLKAMGSFLTNNSLALPSGTTNLSSTGPAVGLDSTFVPAFGSTFTVVKFFDHSNPNYTPTHIEIPTSVTISKYTLSSSDYNIQAFLFGVWGITAGTNNHCTAIPQFEIRTAYYNTVTHLLVGGVFSSSRNGFGNLIQDNSTPPANVVRLVNIRGSQAGDSNYNGMPTTMLYESSGISF